MPRLKLTLPKTAKSKKEQARLRAEFGIIIPTRSENLKPKGTNYGQAPINPTPPETTR